MSTSTGFADGSRFDSALDLSHNNRNARHADLEVSHITAASSVAPSAPWSAYNTRFATDHWGPATPSGRSSHIHTSTEFGPLSCPTQAFDGSLAPFESGFHFGSPNASSSSSWSGPSSPPLLPPPAAAAITTAALTTLSSKYDTSNAIPCDHCSKEYTGTYRRRNLARHVEQKHIKAKGWPCTCTADGCTKVFQRPDARLKHERDKHPELHLPPVQRRHGTEHYLTPPTLYPWQNIRMSPSLDYNVGQWLQEQVGKHTLEPHPELQSCAGVEHIPRAAQRVVTTLQASLGPSDYSRICDSFFTRWESTVQQLSDNQSNAFSVYAKVLEDINAVAHSVDVTECSSKSRHMPHPHGSESRAPHNRRADPGGNGPGSSCGTSNGITSRTDRVSKRNTRMQSFVTIPGKNILVALGHNVSKLENRKVDCPVYKHHLMHNTPPSCRGCGVGVMSQVRSHLNPDRARTHRGFPLFVEQCSRCKQDFVDRQVYDGHKTANACDFRSQTRGDIVVPWVRQYLALYPYATKVPLPWLDEIGWLPDDVIARCHLAPLSPTSPTPFLGGRQASNSSHVRAPTVSSARDEPSYSAAMDHLLNDLVNPTFTQSTRSSTPTLNLNQPDTTSLQSGILSSNNQHWQNVLRSFANHQRTIREAATYLSPEQHHYMAREAERMVDIAHIYQNQLPQLTPAQRHPASLYPESSSGNSVSLYTTPIRHQPLSTNIYEYVTPSPSTLPSSQGYRTDSSRQHTSMFTDPSSTFESTDPGPLSPCLLTSRRRPASLPSITMQHSPRLRRAFNTHLSLPEASTQTDERDNL